MNIENLSDIVLSQTEHMSYECKPIRCFETLQKWALNDNEIEIFSAIPAITESVPVDGPKVLLCHDMKGGYLEDRLLAGSDKFDSYTFFHWAHIDLFVYFSHHLVTIPPISWTTAAHRNGVRVLGTFITEGEKGGDVCRQLLSSQNMIMNTVKQLVNISNQCKFEGWLINIENGVAEIDVPALLQFLALLTESMHESIPGSKVIWYDSVISPSGCVSWQNELNSKNSPFFDACDGIYINYSWSRENLQKSAAFGEQCNRKYDVFAGIDVFGRGCHGGGGMNTNLAINVINDFDLSMAIFAPGWVHEILGSKDFHENQLKFWSSLNLPVRRLLSCLPFQTSFCRGFGKKLFKHGVIHNSEPWSNLLFQDIQILPNAPFCLEDGFQGGGCLLVSSKCHLLNCQIIVPLSGCVIVLVYKPVAQMTNLKITVSEVASNDPDHSPLYLSPVRGELKMETMNNVDFSRFLRNENVSENGWLVDAFFLSKQQLNIIGAVGIYANSDLFLGKLKIQEMPITNSTVDTITDKTFSNPFIKYN